jgi:ubiquinone/menaquinone biosynthesis C-methylase UbiE
MTLTSTLTYGKTLMGNYSDTFKGFWEGENIKDKIASDWSSAEVERNVKLLGIKGHRIFEIGAGIGRIASKIGATGCDSSKTAVSQALCDIKLCDGTGTLNEPDNAYDFVYSIICFQHIEDVDVIKKYCSEAYRILDKGHFVFQLRKHKPAEPSISLYHDPEPILEHLKHVGFKVEIMPPSTYDFSEDYSLVIKATK